MLRSLLVLSLLFAACGGGNVCEKQLVLEDEECFPELEQPTEVEKDECDGDTKTFAKCVSKNESAYCDYYLWLNRGAARREGYTVSDQLAPGNDFLECLDDEGLRQL